MSYLVILFECGNPSHKWVFNDCESALRHFELLSTVYDEVNECQPFLFKIGSSDTKLSFAQICQLYFNI